MSDRLKADRQHAESAVGAALRDAGDQALLAGERARDDEPRRVIRTTWPIAVY